MTTTRKHLSRTAAILTGGAFALSLAARSTGPATVPADDVAELASDALEEEVGQRPDSMDCGEEEVEVVEGTTVECTLTAGADELPATVTIDTVDGNDYTISVQVAEA